MFFFFFFIMMVSDGLTAYIFMIPREWLQLQLSSRAGMRFARLFWMKCHSIWSMHYGSYYTHSSPPHCGDPLSTKQNNKKYQKLTNECSLVVTSQVNQLYIKRLSKMLVITSLMFNNYLTGCADRRHRLNKMIFSLNWLTARVISFHALTNDFSFICEVLINHSSAINVVSCDFI